MPLLSDRILGDTIYNLPSGFEFDTYDNVIYLNTGRFDEEDWYHGSYAERWDDLFDWAEAHNYKIVIERDKNTRVSMQYDMLDPYKRLWLPTRYWVYAGDSVQAELQNSLMFFNYDDFSITCECGEVNNIFAGECRVCRTHFYCSACMSYGRVVNEYNHCEDCCRICRNDECDNYVQHLRDGNECNDCNPRYACGRCARMYTGVPAVVTDTGRVHCPDCAVLTCNACGGNLSTREYRRGLQNCMRCTYANRGDEEFDEEADMTAAKLALPRIPGRETIRLCGVEIEGANGGSVNRHGAGAYLASQLYTAGLSAIDTMAGYHHGNGSGFAHIERDSSVDWELVIGPINMASRDNVQKLNRCMKMVRQAVKDDIAKLDLRCGLHIHVSADRVSVGSAYNLHVFYSYIEDLMYRLGAAKWGVHRSLLNDHYCAHSPKQENKTRFAETYNENRYYGLSFANYFQRMLNHCRCGARLYGSWEECTCNLQKCTFEFRLFNTTANTKKLHAYLALTQALVAKAIETPEITNSDAFVPMPYTFSEFKDMSQGDQEEMSVRWAERLDWIFNELPMTDEEKESLRYCVANSELAKMMDANNVDNNLVTI